MITVGALLSLVLGWYYGNTILTKDFSELPGELFFPLIVCFLVMVALSLYTTKSTINYGGLLGGVLGIFILSVLGVRAIATMLGIKRFSHPGWAAVTTMVSASLFQAFLYFVLAIIN